MRTPRNLSTTAIATVAGVVGGMVASFGPGLAQAAYDAVNSDKVDGLHAVRAGATVSDRKGKLVATDATTGRLPDDIIGRARSGPVRAGALLTFSLSRDAGIDYPEDTCGYLTVRGMLVRY